ncbi:MAG: Omp28-related outer membrane protein, partial [Caldithrix sp.]|nr:Omp28-related outer membrane protein [Caldithrix sp.]
MKRYYSSIIILLLLYQFSAGQARKIVLLEEATNASCAPCATYNPGLQEFYATHFGGVVSVRYHAWWPGDDDPMYQANPEDNQARIQYYNVQGVPNYQMDGINHGVPTNPDLIKKQMQENLDKGSPVKIYVDSEKTADSVKAEITLIVLNPVEATELYLRTGITERMIYYNTAPGTNGETEFACVMRDLLPDADGKPITALSPGDTLRYEFSGAVKPMWNWPELGVIAWLQSDATKEVIQSGMDVPTFIIEQASDDSIMQIVEPQTLQSKTYTIANDNRDSLEVEIGFSDVQSTGGWSYQLQHGQWTGEVLHRW